MPTPNPMPMSRRQLLTLLVAAFLPWASPAVAGSDPQRLVETFLTANQADDVDTMVMLATPRHEPTIRSSRWRDFWKGFVIREHRGLRYTEAGGQWQKAEVVVVLEYSETIMRRVHRQYEALPPGPDKAIYKKTIDRNGRREAAIDVIRIGDTWYWDHD
ncbi:MAG: hypothetical protein HUJ28_01045 [Chromatiales bacterium]|nr:hypothetical protein [Chromatiales bacterium]